MVAEQALHEAERRLSVIVGRAAGARQACREIDKKRVELPENRFGEVSERSKEHAWKVCVRQRTEGSNPSLSAIFKA